MAWLAELTPCREMSSDDVLSLVTRVMDTSGAVLVVSLGPSVTYGLGDSKMETE